jgi:preprotein translocase subunit SecG
VALDPELLLPLGMAGKTVFLTKDEILPLVICNYHFLSKLISIMLDWLNWLSPYLIHIQVVSLIAAIVFILMQNRGAGLSSTFGGSGQVYLTRRGIEKWVVNLTVIMLGIFVVTRFLALYI